MSKLHDELFQKHAVMTRRGPVIPPDHFSAAIDEAMERQRKACEDAYNKFYKPWVTTQEMVAEAILNAKVEDNA